MYRKRSATEKRERVVAGKYKNRKWRGREREGKGKG